MTLKEEFEAYNSRGIYPFHMPGHKRNEALLRSLGAIGNESSYSRDYTETEGLDNLYTASGILRESMDKAARLFGSDICWFLVNGSTCGLLTGIFSLLGQGETALIARNCHKAVYNALFLRGAKTEYLMPPVDPSTGIYGSIRPEDVEEALSRHPDIRLVVITSPTYEGVVSNVASIARICHSRGIPLLVDEAHGSHMRFSSFFPESAVKAGADIVIHSVHKTLPSVTQTALLHINTKSGLVSPEVVRRYLTSFQTSSPSYIFMESIDACRHILEHHPELFSVYEERLSLFSERMKGLKRLSVVIKGTDTIESHPVFYAYDGGKIVISTIGTPLTGRDLELLLLRKYGLQLEMSSLTYAIAMTSICDTEEGFRRLGDALLAIDASIPAPGGEKLQAQPLIPPSLPLPKIFCSFSEAETLPGEYVKLEHAAGRVMKEFVIPYPPGIPVLAPGEVVSAEAISFLQKGIRAGLEIQCGSGVLKSPEELIFTARSKIS